MINASSRPICFNIFGQQRSWKDQPPRDVFGYQVNNGTRIMLLANSFLQWGDDYRHEDDRQYQVDYVHGEGIRQAFSVDPTDQSFRLVNTVTVRAATYWFR